MSRIFQATVKDNRRIASSLYLLTLHPLRRIKRPVPGQFLMVSVGDGLDPLLKRPFSVYRWLDGDLQILYRVVGRGTALLRDKGAGERINVLGPLGNGFPQAEGDDRGMILVAGGLGIASIFSFAEANRGGRVILFYGARTKKELLNLRELKRMGIRVMISTEDGSHGYKGMVTGHLREFLSYRSSEPMHYRLYACGPRPMLREVSVIAEEFGLKGYVSLEENMACGVGTCLGCAVRTRHGYRRVCREGPVFSMEDIVW